MPKFGVDLFTTIIAEDEDHAMETIKATYPEMEVVCILEAND